MHPSFVVPQYILELVGQGHLGRKTPEKGGLYHRSADRTIRVVDHRTLTYKDKRKLNYEVVENAKQLIHVGRYRDAFTGLVQDDSYEGHFVKRLLCHYVAYSYAMIGIVSPSDAGIAPIDAVMAHGFSWAPPSLTLALLGGMAGINRLFDQYGIQMPEQLSEARETAPRPDFGRYFIAA